MSLQGTWSITGTGPRRLITHTPPRQFSGPSHFASLSPWRRTFDVFGFYRWSWHDPGYFAWDCFGFLIFHYKAHWTTAVLIQPTPGSVKKNANYLVPGRAAAIWDRYVPFITVWTGPNTKRVCGFGLELVASVRGVKHWVSRWRRGLHAIRKHHATMVLAHKVPGVPEVLQHVHSFL